MKYGSIRSTLLSGRTVHFTDGGGNKASTSEGFRLGGARSLRDVISSAARSTDINECRGSILDFVDVGNLGLETTRTLSDQHPSHHRSSLAPEVPSLSPVCSAPTPPPDPPRQTLQKHARQRWIVFAPPASQSRHLRSTCSSTIPSRPSMART